MHHTLHRDTLVHISQYIKILLLSESECIFVVRDLCILDSFYVCLKGFTSPFGHDTIGLCECFSRESDRDIHE